MIGTFENLVYGLFKEAFLELREGAVIYLVLNGDIYKVARNHAGVNFLQPSENDKPLVVFKINKDAINSLACEKEFKNIRNIMRNLYLKGDIQVKVVAPTSALVAYRASFMLRKLGLTMEGGCT
ncbi:MAG: hypothetical protein QXR45_15630 [Candidatus Bathyarchaeia archaeon]|nr:hypothetical protein [Candidatus Bathyarchaeota archaeon]